MTRSARIGWAITGALTAAMVYTATPPAGRPLAAGLTVTVWCMLSIAALNRTLTQPVHLPVVIRRPVPIPTPPDAPDLSDTTDRNAIA